MPTDAAIETQGLLKHFGSTRAVDGIDLLVQRGSIYGVLGPNGAGKTTAVRMLATLLPADGGEARVLGHDLAREPRRIRELISLTGQFASVDEDLSASENLVLLARLLGYSRAAARTRSESLLGAFGLAEAANRQAKQFSGGMRRRLDIAASLVCRPQLLFLDEPTTGLDPRSRNQVWDIVRALAAAGTTVLLTTQYLEEADQLADRIAVIDHGRVIAEGTSEQLKARVGSSVLKLRFRTVADRQRAAALLDLEPESSAQADPDPRMLVVQLPASSQATPLLTRLAAANIEASEFSLGQPSLDEVFFALTGQPATAEDNDVGEAA